MIEDEDYVLGNFEDLQNLSSYKKPLTTTYDALDLLRKIDPERYEEIMNEENND